MARLLYIESSPRKERSSSIKIANYFLKEYQQHYPSDTIDTIDLWQETLPEFNGDVIDAKYSIMHGQSHTEAQRKAWRSVEQEIARFKQADRYLFSIPMWNYSIPYRLKHYIDILVQPSYTFSYSPSEGYKGLVVNKPVVLIYARGGAYGPGSGAEEFDLQKKYMETILKFIGFTSIHSIVIEPTLALPNVKDEAIQHAKAEATKIVSNFV